MNKQILSMPLFLGGCQNAICLIYNRILIAGLGAMSVKGTRFFAAAFWHITAVC